MPSSGDPTMQNDASAPSDDLCRMILGFEIDEGVPELSFRDRLARENGWTRGYAQRVIDEYLRFVYLAMASGHVVTPSDQVDQAWHLHLTYTHSYWDRLCGKMLKRPLHHGPTRGGTAESAKYDDQYARTIKSYTKLFGHSPPPDIWPPARIRFGSDLSHVRVNTSRHWVIPKPQASRLLTVSTVFCGLCLMVYAFALGGLVIQKLVGSLSMPQWSIHDPIAQIPAMQSAVDNPLIPIQMLLALLLLTMLFLKKYYEQVINKSESASDTSDPSEFDPRADAASLDQFQTARLLGNDPCCLEFALADLTIRGLCRISNNNDLLLRAQSQTNASNLSEGSTSIEHRMTHSHPTGEAYEISPQSKATMKLLPIRMGDHFEKAKKAAVFINANKKINDELIRRKLMPHRNNRRRIIQYFLALYSLFALSVSLGSIAYSVVILADSDSQVEKIMMLLVLSIVGLLVWQAATLYQQIGLDLNATRRGQAVIQRIKSGIDLKKAPKADAFPSVAVSHAPGLVQFTHPELKPLNDWFLAQYTLQNATIYG
jgi:hypothetical protein